MCASFNLTSLVNTSGLAGKAFDELLNIGANTVKKTTISKIITQAVLGEDGYSTFTGGGTTNAYAASSTTSASSSPDTSTSNKVQVSSAGAATGAFKWVQQMVTPDMFATPDSCLIGFGSPIMLDNVAGQDFKLMGFCQSLSINTGVNVVTFKELRNERTIVIPTKSTPGSIGISRLLGNMPDFVSAVVGGTGWRMDSHAVDCKQLFGLAIIFMSPSRKDTICTLYAERCAVQTMSIPVQAGQFQLYQNIQIVFDRLVDNTTSVSNNTGGLSSSSIAEYSSTPSMVSGTGTVVGPSGVTDATISSLGSSGIDSFNADSTNTANATAAADLASATYALKDPQFETTVKESQRTKRQTEIESEAKRIASYTELTADARLQLTLDSNARMNAKYRSLEPLTERGTDSNGYVMVGKAS